MSPLTTTNRDAAEYLGSVLSLNPIFEADEILAARDRYLGRSRADCRRREDGELQELRKAAQSHLDKVRKLFWTANDGELQAALASLSGDEFSDLKLAADRLSAVFQVRATFVELAQHKKCNHELLMKLQEVVVAAPREASSLKRAYLVRAVADATLHGHVCQMIRLLRRKFADVFALEAEWFESILRSVPIRADSPTEAELIARFNNHPIWGWILILFLVWVIGSIVFAFNSVPRAAPSDRTQMQPSDHEPSPPTTDEGERRKIILESIKARFPGAEIREDGEKVWLRVPKKSSQEPSDAAVDPDSRKSNLESPQSSATERSEPAPPANP